MNIFKKELSTSLLQTAVLKSPKKRVVYAKTAAKQLNAYVNQIDNMYSDMASKLAEAGMIIKRYDDWIDCIAEAMGNKKNEIMFEALKMMNQKYYKNGDKNEKI